MDKRLWGCLLLMGGYACAASWGQDAAAVKGGELKFEEPKDTGLTEIWSAWKKEREEMEEKAHPGKKGSHWWWPAAVAVGDLDGDGDADIVFAHHGAPGTRVFFNQLKETGKLTFRDLTKERTLSGSWEPMEADGSVYVFDFDGDGRPDVMNFSDESKSWAAVNDGKGRFTIREAPFRIAQGHLLDANGDGRIDVMSPLDTPPGKDCRPFINKGGGTYEQAAQFTEKVPGRTWAYWSARPEFKYPPQVKAAVEYPKLKWFVFVATDLDGDGTSEVLCNLTVIFAPGTGFCCLKEAADGSYEDVTSKMGLPYEGRVAAVHDFNGDGFPDLLLVYTQQAGIYLNDGKGHFTRSEDGLARFLSTRPQPDWQTTLDTLADFDEDGRGELLLVTLCEGSKTALFRDVGDGKFEPVPGLDLRGCFQVAACDLDGDGRLDIVGASTNGVRVFLNRTAAAGNFINVKLVGPAENLVGLDAVVEAYRPGGLGEAKKLVVRKRNNADGIGVPRSVSAIGHSCGGCLPVHLGLGPVKEVDLRVIFPGGKTVELRGVKADGRTIEAKSP